MLDFYHGARILPKSDEEIYACNYDYFKINQDNLSDIYHLLIRFDYFLALFEIVSLPSDSRSYLVKDKEEHQNKVFYNNGKPLLDIKEVSKVLSLCSIITSDLANLYHALTEYNLRITNSALRGLFDEKYKEQKIKYYLDRNDEKSKKIELYILFNQMKETNSYQQLFFDPFTQATVNKDSNKIDLSYIGADQDIFASFSSKGPGSLFYDILSTIHHRGIHSFRHLEIRDGDEPLKKHRTYPLNILFGFISIEILSLVFSFTQKYIDKKKLFNLAPSESFHVSDLKSKIGSLSISYQQLTNLHEKVIENYRENLQKYLIKLKQPYSPVIK